MTDKTSHALPPNAAGVKTLRDSVCLPPPHAAEHTDQADHADKTQSTGHGCVLQS